jgi:hypothetical protein
MNSLVHLVNGLFSCREGGEGDKPFELMFDYDVEDAQGYRLQNGCVFEEFALIGGELWIYKYEMDECNPSYYLPVKLRFSPEMSGYNIMKFKFTEPHDSSLEGNWFTYSEWSYADYVTKFKFTNCTLLGELCDMIGKNHADVIVIDLDAGTINVDNIVKSVYIVPKST